MLPTVELLKGRNFEAQGPKTRARLIRTQVLKRQPELAHPTNPREDRFGTIFNDIKKGSFWGPMSILDGPAAGDLEDPNALHRDRNPEEYQAKRQENRNWAQSTFTPAELYSLTGVLVELATEPDEAVVNTAPGYSRGHSTLLRHMVEKSGSIFTDFLAPEAPKILANGAFWEELGAATMPLRVEDVLRDHTGDLDPSLAARFIPLYERNRQHTTYSPDKLDADLRHFSTEGLLTYLKFIKGVAEHTDETGTKTVNSGTIDQLLTPFLLATLEVHPDDPDHLRYETRYSYDGMKEIRPSITYQEIFQDSLVQASIARSPITIGILGSRFGEMLAEKWGDAPGPDSALQALEDMGANGRIVMFSAVKRLTEAEFPEISESDLAETLDNQVERHPVAQVGLDLLDHLKAEVKE